jgi:hypothetical protein
MGPGDFTMATDCLRRRLKNALMRGTSIKLPVSPFELLHAKAGCIVVTPKIASAQEMFLPGKPSMHARRHGRPARESRCHPNIRRVSAQNRS